MKLPPFPSESAVIVPACSPLCEPRTTIVPNWLVGIPRNAICVSGVTTLLPGIGNTSTDAAAADVPTVRANAAVTTVRPAGAAARVINDFKVLNGFATFPAVRPDSTEHTPEQLVAAPGAYLKLGT